MAYGGVDMTTKCTGLMGRIFGHKWVEKKIPVAASAYETGAFFMHGIGPLKIESVTECRRCGATAEGGKKCK